jgi:MacB-like periplasmic core domain
LRNALVMIEVAVALILLVGASLFVRSFLNLQSASPGFATAPLLTARFFMTGGTYATAEQKAQRVDDIIRRVEALPGVVAAFASNFIPLDGGGGSGHAIVDGRAAPAGEEPAIVFTAVTPHLYRTMGLSILKGRDFLDVEGAERRPVAVINQTMAEKLWPGTDAIGQRFRLVETKPAEWLTVIGIAPDIRMFDRDDDKPRLAAAYVPCRFGGFENIGLTIRAGNNNPAALAPAVRNEISASDASLKVLPQTLLDAGDFCEEGSSPEDNLLQKKRRARYESFTGSDEQHTNEEVFRKTILSGSTVIRNPIGQLKTSGDPARRLRFDGNHRLLVSFVPERVQLPDRYRHAFPRLQQNMPALSTQVHIQPSLDHGERLDERNVIVQRWPLPPGRNESLIELASTTGVLFAYQHGEGLAAMIVSDRFPGPHNRLYTSAIAAKKLTNVMYQKIRLFHRSEMTAVFELRPVDEILVTLRKPPDRDVVPTEHRDPERNSATLLRHPGVPVVGHFVVQIGRCPRGACKPIETDVREYAITVDGVFGQLICWVCPLLELLHDPGELRDGRVGEPISQSLRTGALNVNVAHPFRLEFLNPPEALLLYIAEAVQFTRSPRRKAEPGIDVYPGYVAGTKPAHLRGDDRTMVPSLDPVTLIAEPSHQFVECVPDAPDRPAGPLSGIENPWPGIEGITRSNGLAVPQPCTRGLLSGSMTSRNSTTDPGQP